MINVETAGRERMDIVAGPRVWMEGEAVRQLRAVAEKDFCIRAVGMPDLHAGSGGPIGAVSAFAGHVLPSLIGSDAGCGVRVVPTTSRVSSLDKLERRVRAVMQEDLLGSASPAALLEAACRGGPRALGDVPGLPRAVRELAQAELPTLAGRLDPSGTWPDGDEALSLGTIGGGNHFIEISRVADLRRRDVAERFGFSSGSIVVVAHSGSRGLGHGFAHRWQEAMLEETEAAPYLSELGAVCNFARANRFLLACRLQLALGAARLAKVTGRLDVVHNDVSRGRWDGRDVWLHRKGVAPALRDELTVVLGTRGHPSFLMLGTGNEAGLSSVAHGAGRRMTRSEALGKLRGKYARKSLSRTSLGGRVICDRTELLYEEHPDAYKKIDTIVEALEASGLALPVAALEPLITVKQ